MYFAESFEDDTDVAAVATNQQAISASELGKTVAAVLKLRPSERAAIGANARARFLEEKRQGNKRCRIALPLSVYAVFAGHWMCIHTSD